MTITEPTSFPKPWPAEDRAEFIERYQMGLFEEYELARIVRDHLMSLEQAAWLDTNRLTVEDLFNGRFGMHKRADVYAMLDSWNEIAQWELFPKKGRI